MRAGTSAFGSASDGGGVRRIPPRKRRETEGFRRESVGKRNNSDGKASGGGPNIETRERKSMQNKANLQELFLIRARRDRVPVTMFLMNGFQMRGIITGFDAFAVILESEGRQQMIYKHAISTIAPTRPVDLSEERAFL